MHVSLVHLATLEAIVRLGTMAAAADELGYTTGAVSQQMEALGRSVGVQVFERAGRQVELTDAGRALARTAPDLLNAERQLFDQVANSTNSISDRLVIGSWGSTAARLIAPIVAAARAKYPTLDVHSQEVDVDDASNAVQRRAVDMAFGLTYPDVPIRRDPDVNVVPLRRERFGVAVSQDRRDLPRLAELSDLSGEDWILPRPTTQYGMAMRFACRRAGFEPLVRHQVSTDTAATLNLVSQSLGIAPATKWMMRLAPPKVRHIQLHDDVFRDLVLVVPQDHQHRRAIVALVGVIESTVSGLK